MGTVANLWRHPIKGVGREELKNVVLEMGDVCLWTEIGQLLMKTLK